MGVIIMSENTAPLPFEYTEADRKLEEKMAAKQFFDRIRNLPEFDEYDRFIMSLNDAETWNEHIKSKLKHQSALRVAEWEYNVKKRIKENRNFLERIIDWIVN